MEQVTIQEYIPDLDLDKIDIAEENVRKSKQKSGLEDLKSSIEQFGLIHPIVVIAKRGGRYSLIVGQRRYIAFRELGKTNIPALVISPMKSISQRIVSFGENIRRRKLPYEDTIQVCEQLFKQFSGKKSERIKKISKVLGLDKNTVAEYIAHQLVPPEVRTLVTEGKLSKNIVYRITAGFFPDVKKIVSIAKNATRMTRAETRRALDYANKNPNASIDEILNYARKPPPFIEIKIHVDPKTEKSLADIAKIRKETITDLLLGIIKQFIEEEK
jgi:ParB/RepB/Spo0J family partition protein